MSIKDTEELSESLRKRGIKVRPYHANLEPGLRNKVHEKWLNNEYQAVVATVAFGMGIGEEYTNSIFLSKILRDL